MIEELKPGVDYYIPDFPLYFVRNEGTIDVPYYEVYTWWHRKNITKEEPFRLKTRADKPDPTRNNRSDLNPVLRRIDPVTDEVIEKPLRMPQIILAVKMGRHQVGSENVRHMNGNADHNIRSLTIGGGDGDQWLDEIECGRKSITLEELK